MRKIIINKKNNIIKLAIFLMLIGIFLFSYTDNIFAYDEKNNFNQLEKDSHIEINKFYISSINGIIEPTISNYIQKCIQVSEDNNSALIITMDTPGGLDASMREIIKNMLASKIPVIVFVYPEGSRAASAGTFITYASDIAAMAPATSIGAAHPVNIGGEQVPEEMMDKVLNDSISYIRNLAQIRGRNANWAEKAVRESDSITSEKALELKVVDFVASSHEQLLEKIDGLVLEKQNITYILKGKDAVTERIEMGIISRFLHIISNPNIAYILFILGILGIIYEFSQPGFGISGALGALFLILGLYSLSILPINYAGLGLIVLAVILFVLDLILDTGGLLTVAGVMSLIIGSFLLIQTDAPYLRITRSLIIGVSVVISGFMIIVIRAVYKAHRISPMTGITGIVGQTAVVIETLRPTGQVKIHGEIWKAISEEGQKIKKGEMVKVISAKGLTLYVRKFKLN